MVLCQACLLFLTNDLRLVEWSENLTFLLPSLPLSSPADRSFCCIKWLRAYLLLDLVDERSGIWSMVSIRSGGPTDLPFLTVPVFINACE